MDRIEYGKRPDNTSIISNDKKRKIKLYGSKPFVARDCTLTIVAPAHISCGTTGYCGGDGGHGGITFIAASFDDLDIEVDVSKDAFGKDNNLNIVCRGDSELETLIESLKFILNTLESQTERAVGGK